MAWRKTFIVGFAVLAAAQVVWGGFIARPLPISNLNYAAGADRSNIAFGVDDPYGLSVEPTFNGDDFVVPDGVTVITSFTTWSVASIWGEALGNEFDSVSLYMRHGTSGPMIQVAAGTPDTFFDFSDPALVRDSNPNISHVWTTYRGGSDYESTGTEGAYFPIWRNTFSNLYFHVTPGETIQFSVWGFNSVNPDPSTYYGYWYNHFSNALESGVSNYGADNRYLIFDWADTSGVAHAVNPLSEHWWDKGADMNFIATDLSTPEPGTLALFGLGFAALALARRRKLSR
ncbi:MAG: PEP-CTERM sorting domain-containing protein [Acidobacteria bacterium]|nr:PEP-CTERM sorting domain-containing protein [Acidobacteriota bacterium]